MTLDIETEIQKLRANRLMEEDEQIDLYEEALDNILAARDPAHIPLLCQGFDDHTEHHEVMHRLVHIIDSYDEKGKFEHRLTGFLRGVPTMVPHATDWLEIMLFRILNHDTARSAFGRALAASGPAVQQPVQQALAKIAREDPAAFSAKVQEVNTSAV
jgi:hypothetical protein